MSQPQNAPRGDRRPADYFEPSRAVIDDILQFGKRVWPRSFVVRLVDEFFPDGYPPPQPPRRLAMMFSEWAVFDRRAHGGVTLAQRYLAHVRPQPGVRDVVLALDRSTISAYEVVDVPGADTIAVRDGFRGTELLLDIPGHGGRLPKGCTVLARPYSLGDTHRVTPPCIGLDCPVSEIVEPFRRRLASMTASPMEPNWDTALKWLGAMLLSRRVPEELL